MQIKQMKKSWKEMDIGGLTEAGSSLKFKTGSWKSFKPIWDKGKCIHCMICVVDCPENCIPTKSDKREETDLDYCKGCGICMAVCPVKCIKMEEEK